MGIELGELELVARSRRRLESGRILWRLRDDFWECAGAIFPDAFESELELAVGAELEAVSKGWARNIPAEALEQGSVAAVDALASVEVH